MQGGAYDPGARFGAGATHNVPVSRSFSFSFEVLFRFMWVFDRFSTSEFEVMYRPGHETCSWWAVNCTSHFSWLGCSLAFY